MANRNFKKAQNLEQEVKGLFADVAIAAAGAPTLTRGTGIASISRNSAGDYSITLSDTYNRLMHCNVMQLVATAQDANWQIVSETVASTKIIRVRCLTAGVATDPSSGSRLFVKIDVKNSSVI